MLLIKKNYMAKKLYVGGLSYNTTDATLKDTFAAAGTVESATIIIDKMTNRSKGFGFVEMSNDGEAQAAIDALNESEIAGRNIVVKKARPKTEDTGRRGGSGSYRSNY